MLIIFQTSGLNVEPSYAFPCKHNYTGLNYLYFKKKKKVRSGPLQLGLYQNVGKWSIN